VLFRPVVDILYYTPDSESKIVYDARICTRSHDKSTPESDLRVLRDCVHQGHSVVEHVHASFEILCSRACSHELVRYRMCSIAQESQRWVKPDDPEAFFIPPRVARLDEIHVEHYKRRMRESLDDYNYFLACDGVKKEDARYLLRNAQLTTMVMTANFREWLHILRQRLPKHVLPETRMVAEQIRDHLLVVAPVVFEEFSEVSSGRD
jgi:thymidylate synthase (FAD)